MADGAAQTPLLLKQIGDAPSVWTDKQRKCQLNSHSRRIRDKYACKFGRKKRLGNWFQHPCIHSNLFPPSLVPRNCGSFLSLPIFCTKFLLPFFYHAVPFLSFLSAVNPISASTGAFLLHLIFIVANTALGLSDCSDCHRCEVLLSMIWNCFNNKNNLQLYLLLSPVQIDWRYY